MPTFSFFNIILAFFLILSTATKLDAYDETYLVQDLEEFQSGGNEEIEEPISFNESERISKDANRIQFERNAPPQEIPANSAVDTWEEVADKYLCSSGKAVDIMNALKKAFPGFSWYILVQDHDSGYAVEAEDFHNVDNKCGKNMIVWRGIRPESGWPECTAEANSTAQTLLDAATLNVDDSGTIIDTVLEREAVYGLDHYITVSWDGVTEIAALLRSSCYVTSNNKAGYYISKFDPTTTTATTTRKTTGATTSRTTEATTRRTTEATTRRTQSTHPTTSRRTDATTRRTTAKTTSPTTEKTTSSNGEATTKSTTVAVPWEDVADSYLCSSGQAKNILDALDESYPGMDWYVFVQDIHSNWTGSMPRGESHQADNLCQKNMVVWRQPSSGQNCSEDASASALSLINNATGNWNQSEAITDYIVTGEAEYGLDHDMTASWDDLSAVTDWSSKVQSSCHVDNNRTLYYISTSSASVGPYTLLGHTLSILVTTVVIVVAI